MKKIDLKKEFKQLYPISGKKPHVVEVPKMNFLMIDGKGDPNTAKSFQDAIAALYPLAYSIKFKIKKTLEIDYKVMPLEGLWWHDDMSRFSIEDKKSWKWTLMIMQPDFVTQEMVKHEITEVALKKNPISLNLVKFQSLYEGKSAQITHIGPFSEEGPTVDKLHSFIKENGYQKRDKHHEIYLSDTRRAAPKNWKTVIRQPVT